MCPKLEMDQEGDADNLPVPVAMELSIICAATVGDVDELHALLEEAKVGLMGRLGAKLGTGKVFLRRGETRLATQEELLACIPRKLHLLAYYQGGAQVHACSTSRVSQKNITEDEAAVTCKLCRYIIDHTTEASRRERRNTYVGKEVEG